LLGAWGQQVVVCSEGEGRETRTCSIRSWRAKYTTNQNNRWSTQADGHINRADGKRAATTDDATTAAEVRLSAESSIAETAKNPLPSVRLSPDQSEPSGLIGGKANARECKKSSSIHALINRGYLSMPSAGKKKKGRRRIST
jgi:hypothetical protein